MKTICNSFLLVTALCVSASFAHAQAGVDAYFGVGALTDTSNGTSIDTFGTGNSFPANTPGFFNTPKMTGSFGRAGGEFMFSPHFGAGADIDWRFSQGDYAGVNYRPLFYDFYGVYQPLPKGKRVVPELMLGAGGVNVRFTSTSSYCNEFTGCSTSSSFLGSSNHFQARAGAAVAFYVTPHIFLKPEVDVHYVNDFFQFGNNWVPEYSVAVGYRFGER